MPLYQNIKLFIQSVGDKSSNIHPIYKKNFQELIKVIPVIGPLLEANTFGIVDDKILEERLSNLESSCAKALILNDSLKLKSEIEHINNIITVIMITSQELLSTNQKIFNSLDKLVEYNKMQTIPLHIHRKFTFITISGASASGKDQVLNLINKRKNLSSTPIDILTKFTTRPPRLYSDSKYYDFISDEEYDRLKNSGNTIFPYYKRDFGYAFDKTHLIESAQKEIFLFAIFTSFDTLATDKEFLKHLGIKHISILIDVDSYSLENRTESRLLTPEDKEERMKSIKKDLSFINENKKLIDKYFDLRVNNGDNNSINKTLNKIVNFIGLPKLAIQN